MNLVESIILGVVQGATEFLPVSSSGHLVMGQAVLGIEQSGILFEVAVHVATLVSILVVYRERVVGLGTGVLRGDRESLRYVGLVGVATVPAALVGVLGGDYVEAIFDRPIVVGFALLITGAVLWSSRTPLARDGNAEVALRIAVLVGLAQCAALVPGISRSGSTVVMALWLGMEAREAAAFSFMMAIPAIAGAAVLQIPELTGGSQVDWTVLGVGSLAAAVTGVLAIRTFVALLAKRSFHYFAPYCWVVGAAFLAYLSLG